MSSPPPPPPPHAVVSDNQLAEALHNILVQTNPNMFSLNLVLSQLESIFGLNLSHKLDFIRFQITYFFSRAQAQFQAQAQAQNQAQHQARLQAQAQAQARAHIGPVQLEFQHGVGKDGFALGEERNYHFPQNFSFQQPELARTPSWAIPSLSGPDQPVPVSLETPKASEQPRKKRRGGPGGLNKLCGVSPELQTIVGQPTMPRTEIVKQLWAYIKKNNLQDPSNKRKINCNDELRILFETDCTDMFKMNKLLSKHILRLDSDESSKRTKVELESGSESVDSSPTVIVSEVLGNFLGTKEREMSQAEVLKQMWEYVKVNNLEDPSNPMAIRCDEKLKELFGCESISALGISEMLTRRHLTNKS